MLPSLMTPSPNEFCYPADSSKAALAGESPGSAQSATEAWNPHHPFGQQAFTAQGQPQGQQLQGHFQGHYQN